MDQPLDFSFHKENPLAAADDVESPKPMPKPPALPIIPDVESNNNPDVKQNNLSPSDASEVIESLSISAAKPSDANKNKKNEIKDDKNLAQNTGLQDLASSSAPAVPKFPNDAQPPSPKPKPRAKVPLERGFTQVDWLKLTRTQPDLAGLKGGTNKRLITMSEVKQHRTEGDAWTVLKGRVYNITPYLKFHPGGVDMLMKGSGKDCTALFNKYHSWVNAEYLLEKCLVGFFDPEH